MADKKKWFGAVGMVPVFIAMAVGVASGSIIRPTAVTTDAGSDSAANIAHTINNSGLSQTLDTGDSIDPVGAGVFHSGNSTSIQWFTHSTSPHRVDYTSTFTLDGGNAVDVGQMYLWNFVWGGGNGFRAIKDFDLLVSTDGGSNYTSVGQFLALKWDDAAVLGPGGNTTLAQAFPVGVTNVTHAQIVGITSWDSATSSTPSTGIAEVRFDTAAAIPEPGEAVVVLCGFSGLLLGGRRRKRV